MAVVLVILKPVQCKQFFLRKIQKNTEENEEHNEFWTDIQNIYPQNPSMNGLLICGLRCLFLNIEEGTKVSGDPTSCNKILLYYYIFFLPFFKQAT